MARSISVNVVCSTRHCVNKPFPEMGRELLFLSWLMFCIQNSIISSIFCSSFLLFSFDFTPYKDGTDRTCLFRKKKNRKIIKKRSFFTSFYSNPFHHLICSVSQSLSSLFRTHTLVLLLYFYCRVGQRFHENGSHEDFICILY